MQGIFRRRNLPLWDVLGHAVFITGCLQRCFSAIGLKQIDQYRDELERRLKPAKLPANQWEHHKQKRFFAFVDNLLDNHSSVQHLVDDEQAKIVANAFLHFADERYERGRVRADDYPQLFHPPAFRGRVGRRPPLRGDALGRGGFDRPLPPFKRPTLPRESDLWVIVRE
jgi:hypothetical protein